MLFNSYIFIFLFLPATLAGFYMIGNRGYKKIASAWLVGASLFFYAWWNPAYLGLLLISILFNFSLGISLSSRPSKIVLITGVVINLLLLGYFKYAGFFIENLNVLFDSGMSASDIILPLAISFFTFQQIAYLVDAYKGDTKEYDFLQYCLFVTFFPQLIAGPIVHHKEMLPQFARKIIYRLDIRSLSIGLSIFTIGLFKKVVIADGIAVYSTPVFDAAEIGTQLTFHEAWIGSLAYTLQLYFDFSGYSDMAIGLARMFGIILPVNFFSPYKANNIIDFWKRWHITLSRFLKDYLYIPLGGNRKGNIRRYINLLITMLLGGLWHGAGWTFILWGAMHGVFLIINHAWLSIKDLFFPNNSLNSLSGKVISRVITFIAIVLGWVVFRSESLDAVTNMYSAMFGFNGLVLPIALESFISSIQWFSELFNISYSDSLDWKVLPSMNHSFIYISLLLLWVWFAPNTLEWFSRYKPALAMGLYTNGSANSYGMFWKPTVLYAFIMAIIATLSIMKIQGASEFLYFRF